MYFTGTLNCISHTPYAYLVSDLPLFWFCAGRAARVQLQFGFGLIRKYI
jgi:hypothetical protein